MGLLLCGLDIGSTSWVWASVPLLATPAGFYAAKYEAEGKPAWGFHARVVYIVIITDAGLRICGGSRAYDITMLSLSINSITTYLHSPQLQLQYTASIGIQIMSYYFIDSTQYLTIMPLPISK